MTCGIYLILCNERPYVGQSSNIEARWEDHIRRLRAGKHANWIIQSTWNKYGEVSLKFSVLEECHVDVLTEREHYWCLRLDSYKSGCNLAPVAKNTMRGKLHTKSSKEKISAKMKSRIDPARSFTSEQVLDVWLRYMDGESSLSIAASYGTNQKAVWFVVNRHYYREVELPPLCRRKERRRKGGGRKKKNANSDSTSLFAAAGVPIKT